MGFFGGSKVIVGSATYNLAGDENNRPSYMKSLVVGNIISNTRASMSETIQQGYITGPGMQLRRFFNWAENNYSLVGVPTGNLGGRQVVDNAAIQDQIPHGFDETVQLEYVHVGPTDYSYWAEQWMFENHPDKVNTAWKADMLDTSNTITITFADLTTTSFVAADFIREKPYIYAYYMLQSGTKSEPTVEGSEVAMDPTDPFPDTTGWTLISNSTDAVGANTREIWVYQKTVYMGQDPDTTVDQTYSIKYTRTHTEVRDPMGAVVSRSHKTDTQKLINRSWSQTKVFIYRIGSGNLELDQLMYAESNEGEFMPYIPVRLENEFLSDTYKPDLYAIAKKAYKKATKGNFDELVSKIAENESLEDIDHAYIVHAVSLNAKENMAREYIYRFFDKLRLRQTATNADYLIWKEQMQDFRTSMDNFYTWKQEQTDVPEDGTESDPPPALAPLPGKPGNYIRVTSNGEFGARFDMAITWQVIIETTGVGLKKPDAKSGDFWLTLETLDPLEPDQIYSSGSLYEKVPVENTEFAIHWQVDDNNWKTLTVKGAYHQNMIYQGKNVLITPKDALEDTEVAGFLVPLHYATLKEMGLVSTTQLSMSCSFIVFNCYEIVKQKWYETDFFKVIVVIVIITIAVLTGGAGAGFGAGILGSAAAVGAAIGLTGVIAIIAGAIINAIVAMIITQLLMAGSVLVFGEKWGRLIGAVISMVALSVGTAMSTGMSTAQMFNALTSAQNLLQITSAVGNGIAGVIQANARETLQETERMLRESREELDRISQRFAEEFGYGRAVLDPMGLTDTPFGNFIESEEDFLTRTLLTGGDIAEISLDMINNFSTYTLDMGVRL